MSKSKKTKIKGFYPMIFALRKVLRHLIEKLLKPEEISKLEQQIPEISLRQCLREPYCKYCWDRKGLQQRIKEIVNIKMGRPAKAKGGLTLNELVELAEIVGIIRSELIEKKKSVLWSQIVKKITEDRKREKESEKK